MKHLSARLLVIAVLGTLLASAGCVLNDSDLVVTDKICVQFDEVQTDGSFSTFAVSEDFKEQLDKKLAQYGKTKKDVKSIHMVSGSFKSVKVEAHDWNVTAIINIARDDVPGEPFDSGPAPLVAFENQSLKALKGQPNYPPLHAEGVAVVNDALASLLAGEDPRMLLVVESESVTPTPSVSDPMVFSFTACVEFQVVIAKNK